MRIRLHGGALGSLRLHVRRSILILPLNMSWCYTLTLRLINHPLPSYDITPLPSKVCPKSRNFEDVGQLVLCELPASIAPVDGVPKPPSTTIQCCSSAVHRRNLCCAARLSLSCTTKSCPVEKCGSKKY